MSEQHDRILIIDDSEDVILPLTHYFETQGATVFVVSDPDRAIQEALACRPNIILLAATLRGVDGVTLFRQLRQRPRTATVPVMFLAGFRDTQRQNALLAAGADDVITRPFDIEILGLRIRNAIQRSHREGMLDPTTGLPTDKLLQDRIAALRQEPDWCTLEITIAHFDAFRARYDFFTGNEALRYTADRLLDLVEATGEDGAFVGYTGDNAFIVALPCQHVAALKTACQTELQDGLRQFYTFIEREQGFVTLDDSTGNPQTHPLMEVRVSPHVPAA
ncbi:MAG: hypothetical protein Kow0077_13170 [Anaerolineae bacterium]